MISKLGDVLSINERWPFKDDRWRLDVALLLLYLGVDFERARDSSERESARAMVGG